MHRDHTHRSWNLFEDIGNFRTVGWLDVSNASAFV